MQKFGSIAVMGETNSGKSTLVNKIVGDKISIVSHKVQTTRRNILGIYTESDNQMVFIDTPGIFKANREIDKHMIKIAYSSIASSDNIILMVDSKKGITENLLDIIKKLSCNQLKDVLLVLNKIDLIDKTKLLSLSNELFKYGIFKKIFMISALKNKGVSDLVKYLLNNLKPSSWMFNKDDLSNTSLKFMATEITREKIYKYLHKELPYMIVVAPEVWEENESEIKIKQVIYVTNQSHKKIVIGEKASNIKRIGIDARKELNHILNKKVHLYLFVKLKEDLFENIEEADHLW